MSLNPSKTDYMILTTRQKRQILSSPPVQLLVGNKQLHEVSKHKLLGVIIDKKSHMGPTHTLSMQITSEKGLSISKN